MCDDSSKELWEKYKDDSRVACKYGESCYQKNPVHHEKYKHPPNHHQDQPDEAPDKKRKAGHNAGDKIGLLFQKYKFKKLDKSPRDSEQQSKNTVQPSDNNDEASSSNNNNDNKSNSNEIDKCKTHEKSTDTKVTDDAKRLLIPDDLHDKQIISQLFLVEMPEDFYHFFQFCCLLSSENPCLSLKAVDLELVGPYDVLDGKIKEIDSNNSEKYLRHWRYFYDPPEFQTILKGSNKDGLHYGYWRDNPNKNPIFVAKNYAKKNCKIVPVASNLFSAVQIHIEEYLKTANVFEKSKILRLLQEVKDYIKNNDLDVEIISSEMKSREKEVVAKTFHGAGIIVPYDKTTQLGYRCLSISDSHLSKLLEQIETATSEDEKKIHLSKLDDVIRLATIAADECDFGTPLELGHDLFSSGVYYVQRTALRMLTMSYGLLKYPQFSRISEAHIPKRTKGYDLSFL